MVAVAILIYAGHHYQWFPRRKASDLKGATIMIGLALAFMLYVWWMSTWPNADHYVVRVEWSMREVRLQPRAGRPFEVRWDRISGVEVPQDPGYRGPYAALYYHAKVRVPDDPKPFLIPLDWNAQCTEFLKALEQHASPTGPMPDS